MVLYELKRDDALLVSPGGRVRVLAPRGPPDPTKRRVGKPEDAPDYIWLPGYKVKADFPHLASSPCCSPTGSSTPITSTRCTRSSSRWRRGRSAALPRLGGSPTTPAWTSPTTSSPTPSTAARSGCSRAASTADAPSVPTPWAATPSSTTASRTPSSPRRWATTSSRARTSATGSSRPPRTRGASGRPRRTGGNTTTRDTSYAWTRTPRRCVRATPPRGESTTDSSLSSLLASTRRLRCDSPSSPGTTSKFPHSIDPRVRSSFPCVSPRTVSRRRTRGCSRRLGNSRRGSSPP